MSTLLAGTDESITGGPMLIAGLIVAGLGCYWIVALIIGKDAIWIETK